MDFSKYNLNIRKLIFIIVDLVVIFFIAFLFITLNKKADKIQNTSNGDLDIWIYGDNKSDFTNFVDNWKNEKGFNDIVTHIESFSSREEYNLALSSAIISGKGPDIFVLNSSEKSIFENQVLALNPGEFDPDKFKNDYSNFLVDDMIFSVSVDGKSEKKLDYLKGIPVGYEMLGIFYNRLKGLNPSDFNSWSALFSAMDRLKNKRGDIIPIGMGRGKTVLNSDDIITQFFMLEGANGIDEVGLVKAKTVLNTYFSRYADKDRNGYDKVYEDLIKTGKSNLDLFSRGEIAMIIGFPRLLFNIDKSGFRKSALYVKPFPAYFVGSGKSYVNYNYFVLNKDTDSINAAEAFLKYLNSDEGAGNYLNKFPYYFPARLSLEEDYLNRNILDGYKIKLKDFNNDILEKHSFDKKIKVIYDYKIKNLLDMKVNYLDYFFSTQKELKCVFEKIVELKNLSDSCSK